MSGFNERLDSFADLAENWDSYGAAPIAAEAIASAKRLFVCPTSRGGVAFEWTGPDEESLIFEIAPDGSVEGFWINANGNEFEWESAP